MPPRRKSRRLTIRSDVTVFYERLSVPVTSYLKGWRHFWWTDILIFEGKQSRVLNFLIFQHFFLCPAGKEISSRCQPRWSRGKREVFQTGWSLRGTKHLFTDVLSSQGICHWIPRCHGSVVFVLQVLSDEVKRKQYDTYGAAGFDPNRAGAGQQQYYRAGGTTIDPEELFRKIFGEFAGGFGNINNMFDQRPEVTTH